MTHRALVIAVISALSLICAPRAGLAQVSEPPLDDGLSKARPSSPALSPEAEPPSLTPAPDEAKAPAEAKAPVAAAVSRRATPAPLTWSELNRGLFINPALVAHVNTEAATSGIGFQLDTGYQLGFGLGFVGHMEYTVLLPEVEGVTGYYMSFGGGLRFAAPVFSWLRLWVQGTYGVAGYYFEDTESGEALASTGFGTSLGLRGGLDVHISGTKRGGHVFIGVSGGVDLNRFEDDSGAELTDTAKKLAISVTYIL